MADGRPKVLDQVKGHRTKAERELRKQAEKELSTGKSMKEWPQVRVDSVAHAHYLRICGIMKAIKRNDALHEPVLNRYCMMLSECDTYETMIQNIGQNIQDLEIMKANGEIEFAEYLAMCGSLREQLFKADKVLTKRREMLLAIEKENLMTVQAAIRGVPKKPDNENPTGIAAFMQNRA